MVYRIYKRLLKYSVIFAFFLSKTKVFIHFLGLQFHPDGVAVSDRRPFGLRILNARAAFNP